MKCSSIIVIATCLSAIAVNTLLKRDFTLMMLHQVLRNTTLRTASTNIALIYIFRQSVPCHRMSPYINFTRHKAHGDCSILTYCSSGQFRTRTPHAIREEEGRLRRARTLAKPIIVSTLRDDRHLLSATAAKSPTLCKQIV